jgi:hypothetical protein
MTISAACAGEMHMHCDDWECSCWLCHHICERCLRRCRTQYRAMNSEAVCAICYKAEITANPVHYTQMICEECHEPKAGYRDPRSGDKRHLCSDCHRAAGHRYQEGGVWHVN